MPQSNLFDLRPEEVSGLGSVGLEIEVDEAVVAQFPKGSTVLSVTGHGASHWTRTARIDIRLLDDTPKSYFLKKWFILDALTGADLSGSGQVATGSNGHSMMNGEYESSKAINTAVSDFAPKAVGWGTFASNPELHFFLQDFHEMEQGVPDMEKFTLKLAEMHLKNAEMHSQMKERFEGSGRPRFGFHVTTHNGCLPQDNRWTDTWEEFYIQGIERMLDLEEKAQGRQPDEMKVLLAPLFEKVIPRLLRPMETQGRSITPCLIHGDMWHGNTSTDVATNEPIVFDACCFFGHNEFDLRTMRARTRYKFGRSWQESYLEHYPAAFPVEDFDDRSALYML
ncbi:Ketosamine-3-kinase [Lachnellula arida]|uniref:protein-ribulosamine 3-kinase n=1 Tax=Lachnellula arida TaxID=1316785 RepID=A0A8T9BKZ1_9HELO|nr:Ketosamine-3-kinase [Lachnellula arida]